METLTKRPPNHRIANSLWFNAMLSTQSIEDQNCTNYLKESSDEVELRMNLGRCGGSTTLIVTQGFEERSLGVIELFANANVILGSVVISRYSTRDKDNINTTYEDRFEVAAAKIAPGRFIS